MADYQREREQGRLTPRTTSLYLFVVFLLYREDNVSVFKTISKIVKSIFPKADKVNMMPSKRITTTSNITSKSDIKLVYKQKLSNGLYPGEIVLLDWLINKTTNVNYPGYFYFRYGIDAPRSAKKLIKRSYLTDGSLMDSLPALKVNELKSILRDNDLKVSGVKKELIQRIQTKLSDKHISKYIDETKLVLTTKGKKVIDKYYYIPHAHKYGEENGFYDVASAISYMENIEPGSAPSNNKIAWVLYERAYKNASKQKMYGLMRNALLKMAQLLEKNKKYNQALTYYIKVIISDLSGLSNQYLFHPKQAVCLPYLNEKVTKLMRKTNTQTLESDFNNAWDFVRPTLVFHYLSKQKCFECVENCIKGNYVAVEKELMKSFTKVNRTELQKKHNIYIPED